MLRRTLLALCLCLLPVPAIGQQLALSFDDGWDPRQQPRAAAWNAALIQSLAEAQLSAILFAQGGRVDTPEGLALVAAWGRAGHAVGNHTYRHRSLGSRQTSLSQFVHDAARNDSLLRGMPGWTPRFRFPYLKEGDTAEKRDGMRRWLKERGYTSGAVTIDASDWYYDTRYRQWRERHPTQEPTQLREAYLEHLWSRAVYYDSLSRVVLGRSVPHVLLLHTNQINAEFLPHVIERFRAGGWEWITPEAAYRDSLYQKQPRTMPAGESLIWALAKEKGLPGLRYPAEDEVYEKPILDRIIPLEQP